MRPLFLLCLFTVTGCGTQIGTENAFGCQVDSEEDVSDLSTAPSGFSLTPQEALDQVLGDFAGTFTYEMGGTEAMTLSLVRAGDLVVERRSMHTGDGAEINLAADPDCVDALRIPATISFAAGTALDEEVAGHVFVDIDGKGSVSVQLTQDDVQGDATPPTLDVGQLAKVWMSLYGTWRGEDWQGSVGFTGESYPSGTGDDATVSAANDPLGDFLLTRVAE